MKQKLLKNYPYNLELINTDINNRWENGISHHPKSIELFKAIEILDFCYLNDYFHFKSGGDGDNGEQLMYLFDIYFESKEEQEPYWDKI